MTRTQTGKSVIEFATRSRPHIGLPVRNLEQSKRFYETLLGQPPTKERPGYAKFETEEPPLNLALNEVAEGANPHPTQHFGIQVKDTREVVAHHGRLRAAGFATLNEEGVTCCFAVQDKIWAIDPDGYRWEVFVVLEADTEEHSAPPRPEGRMPGAVGTAAASPAGPVATPAGDACCQPARSATRCCP